jgi:phospholipase/carboxylesterase
MSDLGFVHHFVPARREGLPNLVLLHGTGGNEHDLIPLGQDLLPGAALLSVRGKVLENGMPRFFRRFAEGVFDLEDLKVRTGELAAFLVAARKKYELQGTMLAVGYSNGANIAASLMLTYPGVLAGGVLLRAMPTFTLEPPVDLTGTRVLLCAGRRDPIVRVDQSLELQGTFAKCGADVKVHWHDGGHELGQDDVNAAQEWLLL